jgi:hypothetical protein
MLKKKLPPQLSTADNKDEDDEDSENLPNSQKDIEEAKERFKYTIFYLSDF